MSIRAVTFNEQACKSEDDALIHDLFLNNHCGPIKDCELSYDVNTITVGQGYFMIAGRLVHINGNEVIEPSPVENGTKYCKLIFSLDMTKENTAKDFKQGKFEVIGNYDTYPDTTQEDLHNGGTTYQLEVCKFTLTPEGITSHENIWYPVEINGVIAYAKKEVDAMIAEYEAECDEIIKNASMPVSHIHETVMSEEGSHGIRYHEGVLQAKNDNDEWVDCTGGTPPEPVTNVFAYYPNATTIHVAWDEPITIIPCVNYLIYKSASAPTSIADMELVGSTLDTEYEFNVDSCQKCYVVVAAISNAGGVQEDVTHAVNAYDFVKGTTTLESLSWEEIDRISYLVDPRKLFSIGATKNISISGTSIPFMIYAFFHDIIASTGEKARFTFGMCNCMASTRVMNSSGTNAGGWPSTAMKTYLDETVKSGLPSDLKAVVKKVKKYTCSQGDSADGYIPPIEITQDELFLFSETEVFGAARYSAEGQGEQYPIFTNASSRIKKVGTSASRWWLRSPYATNTSSFVLVNTDGSVYSYSAAYAFGVAFGFCI